MDKLSVKEYEDPFRDGKRLNTFKGWRRKSKAELNRGKASAFRRWPVTLGLIAPANQLLDGWS